MLPLVVHLLLHRLLSLMSSQLFVNLYINLPCIEFGVWPTAMNSINLHREDHPLPLKRNLIATSKSRKSSMMMDEDVDERKSKSNDKWHRLVSFRELPEYMKDNEFIVGYYRAHWPLHQALFSIFRWHNETINVWTHFIGFILFLWLTIVNFIGIPQLDHIMTLFSGSFPVSLATNLSHDTEQFVPNDVSNLLYLNHNREETENTPPATRWPFLVFLSGSMFCLLSSSICHLFSCNSRNLNILLTQIDYAGITVMIITSFFPPIFYIFQCEPRWQFIYLGGITFMGICTLLTLTPSMSISGKYRGFRALLFCSMGLFGVVPAIHACIVNWSNPLRDVTLGYELAMGFFYLTGAGFYVGRIPERWKPGWFDLAGHSHQIFHVLVVMGALAHYGATLFYLEWRDRVGCDL